MIYDINFVYVLIGVFVLFIIFIVWILLQLEKINDVLSDSIEINKEILNVIMKLKEEDDIEDYYFDDYPIELDEVDNEKLKDIL
jgi:hypothetical protein